MDAVIGMTLNTGMVMKEVKTKFIKLAFISSLIFHASIFMLLSLRPDKAKVAHVVPTDVTLIKLTSPATVAKNVVPKAVLKPSISRKDIAQEKSTLPTPKQVTQPINHGQNTASPNESSLATSNYSSVLSNYVGSVIDLIDHKKRYPTSAQRRGQQGRVILTLKLGQNGDVLDVKIREPSPFSDLNEASLDAIQRIKAFPVIPMELKLHELILKIPVEYKLQ